MEAHDIKETWKAGVEKNIKPYPEEKLNEMIIKSARKSIKTVYPGTVFRLVVVAVVVYLIVMLFIREQSMERAYVDIAALAVLSVSYFLWERSAYRMRKYTNGMAVKEWLEYRIKEVEKSVKFNTKYGWIVYTCSFLSAIGFYVFYLMAMNITPGILNVVVVPLGIAIYLLIIDRSLGRNYRKTLRELKDLYKQFEVED
ncbi:hypothetical protein K0F10_17405 [Bacteroides fragilis]|uniref:hypothetical protein n=1 Tax=Bacteroides TaxID=816 RepID=UPI001897CDA5|nr:MULTISPECIES: hypothetical protein [Bacteroides]MCE8626554.1 hypothetical protein [Bacteroides fragilis]MCE8701504.1 hypothetical protein [Bacteroides fragilis]MCE8706201.1 hypothetical protein [Bacteroides fragilis]MCE9327715.1 hypothetical protein [Bacteroides fragilis]MCE9449510.1 hypothetical protein [Bacteroides fragilis]